MNIYRKNAKKNKSIYFLLMILVILFPSKIKAACDLERLKEEANKVEIIYDIDMDAYNKTGKYNSYTIKVNNLTDDIYVYDWDTKNKFWSSSSQNIDNTLKTDYKVGTKQFVVYSQYCKDKLRTISVTIPKFNEYSKDKLCENMDTEKLPVCGKWYDTRGITRSDFENIVAKYNKQNDITDDPNSNNTNKSKENTLNRMLDFIKSNILYIVIGIVIIAILIIVHIILKRKRERLD